MVAETVMVVAKAVASPKVWKPAREFRRLPLSWEGYVAAKQARDHPWRVNSSWRFKVSQAQENLLHSQMCPLSIQVSGAGVRGCTKPPTGVFPLWPSRVGTPWLKLRISSHHMAVLRKTVTGLC